MAGYPSKYMIVNCVFGFSQENNHLKSTWLVVGIPTPLKNDGVKVSWDDFPFPSEWKVIKVMFFKPPTRH
jgi:hypothetical protein